MEIRLEKGQSLVELAISLTILLILLSGMVELSTLFFQHVQLRDASQEGALYGSVCQDEAKIKQRVIMSSSSPIDLSKADIQISYESNGVVEGGGIKVSISYRHKVFMPFATKLFGEYINLNAFTTDTILKINGCE